MVNVMYQMLLNGEKELQASLRRNYSYNSTNLACGTT
jgi:hypothetical protein